MRRPVRTRVGKAVYVGVQGAHFCPLWLCFSSLYRAFWRFGCGAIVYGPARHFRGDSGRVSWRASDSGLCRARLRLQTTHHPCEEDESGADHHDHQEESLGVTGADSANFDSNFEPFTRLVGAFGVVRLIRFGPASRFCGGSRRRIICERQGRVVPLSNWFGRLSSACWLWSGLESPRAGVLSPLHVLTVQNIICTLL
jgi:hypothetical protein